MKGTAIILAIYMFLGSLIPKTDFSQLVHLPDLVQHYQLHVVEAASNGETFSFGDFIKVHYITPDEHTSNHHEHGSLPFQSFNPGFKILIAKAFMPDINWQKPNIFTLIAYQNCFHLKGFFSILQQPPSV